ncbi:hypothetical protein C5L14_16745 [Labrys okinawensis]|uniref:TNase-like domain-containing protein n=1 Tax=Labrys okinawensis TaxID=346911 RepID=A0A2S9QC62_9HYPH|nr:thermonuclease family protein [Labrys okinawensis]PRH86934.1 hypothetical protein C5L14_16745 [Labrys okinawensis]
MKSVLRIAFAFLLVAPQAGAATYEAVDGNRIIVLDGDTVALPCKKPGRGCAERVRLRDIDAPEVFHPDCAEGLQQGLKAKERLAQLIRGKVVYVERDGHKDIYGRTLGALRIGSSSGVNAGMQLVREDLARPWKAGAAAREERRLWWCGSVQ